MATHFDRLPVEILHMIFQFISNCDVIWSFHRVSPYLDAVLSSFYWHTLNFRSMSKCRFDFICNHLELSRIISLTFSNDLKTPNQVQIFFHRYNLRDFINLRCLTLLSITNEDIYLILSDLPKLRYLTSLFTSCRSSQPLLIGQTLNQLISIHNLSISYGDIFDHNVTFPLHTLKVLDAGTCNFLELRRLQRMVPSLVSLKIILQANHQLQLLSDVDIWSGLERLNLTLDDEVTTTFNEMEQFLVRFHNLTHLTLNIQASADQLANGNRWATCSTIISLCKFDFIFTFKHPLIDSTENIDKVFNSFSTFFWRDLKKWYVAITPHNVYTISCFDDQLFTCTTSPPLSTSPDYRWFYSKVKRIKLEKNNSSNDLHRFHKLEKLDIPDDNMFLAIGDTNQFPHLRHLIFHQSISKAIVSKILTRNPYINRLTLSQIDFNQLFSFETIHYLYLEQSIQLTNRTQIKALSRIFPLVKRLSVHLKSIQLICHIVNYFSQLETGIIYFNHIVKPISQEWLKDNTHLSDPTCSFTYRNEPTRFLLWINNTGKRTIASIDKLPETSSINQEQRSDKCLIQ